MDPFTLTAILGFGGKLVSSFGQIEQGKAEMEAARYNARVSMQQAGQIREKSKLDASFTRDQGIKQIGEMRANYAASGIAMEGSALDVLSESARLIKRDELTVRYEGELNARAREADAKRIMIEGKNARNARNVSAGSSFLGGIAELF